jgi:large repetitive protein
VDGTGSPVADTECSVDGSAFASCSSPLELTGVSEGVHEFQIRSTDAAGNIEATISYQWTQGDPPETFLDSTPVTPSSSTTASFSFSSDRDPVGFRCLLQRVGGSQAYFQTCGSPKTYTGLTDGSYRFEVRAFDSLNNPDPTPAVYDFVIDRSAPVVTIDPVTSPTASGDVSFSFSADEPGATFACSMDGGSFGACTSPETYTGLSDGSHTFRVRASDALGNTSSPVSATVVVDTTAPSAAVTSGPAANTSSSTAAFTFTGTDSGTGVASFECSVDAAAFAACTSPHSVSGLADGPHTFEVRAIDQVGNVGSAASHSWSIDATAPTVTIVKPTPGIYAADQRIGNASTVQSFGDLTTQVTLDDSSGIASVAFTADGTTVAHSCSGADCSALIESPGPNTMVDVVITVTDTAGNTATATVQIHFLA